MRKYKNFRSRSRLSFLNKITLLQFRNYSFAEYVFPNTVTCITGANGSGKTNLLDAVYYLCYTKSYFTAYQQNIVQTGLDGFRLEGQFTKDGKTETVACKWKQGKKEISQNGVEYERVNDHIGKYPAVMIAPDDMELINDGSELRRKWVDGILSQTDREYLERLMRYQRILLQRNAWLKLNALNPPFNSVELEYYNKELAADGTYIHHARKVFLQSFLPILNRFYALLSGNKEQINMEYESDLFQRSLDNWLTGNLQNDLRMQRTLKGIHKDDWNFILNGLALKQFGSQGQKKSFLFALKLAHFSYLKQTLGNTPILLLDDIFEKLDQSRMEALLSVIRTEGFGQVLLTDTHADRVQQAFGEGVDVGFVRL